jgi:hypothetical protein
MEPQDRYTARRDDGGQRRKRRAGWLWLLLALLAALVAAIVVGLTRGGDDPGSSASSTSGAGNASTMTTQASNGVKGASTTMQSSGSLTSGSTDVLTRAGSGSSGSLASLRGKPVTASSVPVASVVGDEVFWVGRGASRVLVHLTHTSGESSPTVRSGDRVDFRGTVAANGARDTAIFGITRAEDASLYKQEKVHIESPISTLEVTSS